MRIIGALLIANRALNGLEIERRIIVRSSPLAQTGIDARARFFFSHPDIVLAPITHHFLCNFCIMLRFKTFRSRSIGWALFGVNFIPLQEIEAIMGGGRIFDNGPFFARLP